MKKMRSAVFFSIFIYLTAQKRLLVVEAPLGGEAELSVAHRPELDIPRAAVLSEVIRC
jgi:hypothetical protein